MWSGIFMGWEATGGDRNGWVGEKEKRRGEDIFKCLCTLQAHRLSKAQIRPNRS